MKVKIGDTITAKDWSGSLRSGIVSEIEICKPDEKYGRPVESTDTAKHANGVITFGTNWCYFYQLVSVHSTKTKRA